MADPYMAPNDGFGPGPTPSKGPLRKNTRIGIGIVPTEIQVPDLTGGLPLMHEMTATERARLATQMFPMRGLETDVSTLGYNVATLANYLEEAHFSRLPYEKTSWEILSEIENGGSGRELPGSSESAGDVKMVEVEVEVEEEEEEEEGGVITMADDPMVYEEEEEEFYAPPPPRPAPSPFGDDARPPLWANKNCLGIPPQCVPLVLEIWNWFQIFGGVVGISTPLSVQNISRAFCDNEVSANLEAMHVMLLTYVQMDKIREDPGNMEFLMKGHGWPVLLSRVLTETLTLDEAGLLQDELIKLKQQEGGVEGGDGAWRTNSDHCSSCGGYGDIFGCATCPRSYHRQCGVGLCRLLADGVSWLCTECASLNRELDPESVRQLWIPNYKLESNLELWEAIARLNYFGYERLDALTKLVLTVSLLRSVGELPAVRSIVNGYIGVTANDELDPSIEYSTEMNIDDPFYSASTQSPAPAILLSRPARSSSLWVCRRKLARCGGRKMVAGVVYPAEPNDLKVIELILRSPTDRLARIRAMCRGGASGKLWDLMLVGSTLPAVQSNPAETSEAMLSWLSCSASYWFRRNRSSRRTVMPDRWCEDHSSNRNGKEYPCVRREIFGTDARGRSVWLLPIPCEIGLGVPHGCGDNKFRPILVCENTEGRWGWCASTLPQILPFLLSLQCCKENEYLLNRLVGFLEKNYSELRRPWGGEEPVEIPMVIRWPKGQDRPALQLLSCFNFVDRMERVGVISAAEGLAWGLLAVESMIPWFCVPPTFNWRTWRQSFTSLLRHNPSNSHSEETTSVAGRYEALLVAVSDAVHDLEQAIGRQGIGMAKTWPALRAEFANIFSQNRGAPQLAKLSVGLRLFALRCVTWATLDTISAGEVNIQQWRDADISTISDPRTIRGVKEYGVVVVGGKETLWVLPEKIASLHSVADFEFQKSRVPPDGPSEFVDSPPTWFCETCAAPRLSCLSQRACEANVSLHQCHVCARHRSRTLNCIEFGCGKSFCDDCLRSYGILWLPRRFRGNELWTCLVCVGGCDCPRCRANKKPVQQRAKPATAGSLASFFIAGIPKDLTRAHSIVRAESNESLLEASGGGSSVAAFSVAIPKFAKILKDLMRSPQSKYFRDPVPEHAVVFSSVCDLTTVRTKLQDGKYTHGDQLLFDVRCVFANAVAYNGAGSEIGKFAQEFSTKFEKSVAAIPGGSEWQTAAPDLQIFAGKVDLLVGAILDKKIIDVSSGEETEFPAIEYLLSFTGRPSVPPAWTPARDIQALSLVTDFEASRTPPGEIPIDFGIGSWEKNVSLQSKRARTLGSDLCHVCDGTEDLVVCPNSKIVQLKTAKASCTCAICGPCHSGLTSKKSGSKPCIHCAHPERCCPPPIICSVCGEKSIRWQSCSGMCNRDVCLNCVRISFGQDLALKTTVLVDAQKRKSWFCPPCNSIQIFATKAVAAPAPPPPPIAPPASKKSRRSGEEAGGEEKKASTPGTRAGLRSSGGPPPISKLEIESGEGEGEGEEEEGLKRKTRSKKRGGR